MNDRYWYRYSREREKLILGTYKQWYSNGNIYQIAHYKNGILHGENLRLEESGDTMSFNNYHKGVLHGKQIDFRGGGRRVRERNYKRGILHGYNSIGSSEGEYVDGKKEGPHLIGTKEFPRSIEHYKGDILDGLSQYFKVKNEKSILLEEIGYKGGVKDGIYRKYSWETGKISVEGFYKDGLNSGEWIDQYSWKSRDGSSVTGEIRTNWKCGIMEGYGDNFQSRGSEGVCFNFRAGIKHGESIKFKDSSKSEYWFGERFLPSDTMINFISKHLGDSTISLLNKLLEWDSVEVISSSDGELLEGNLLSKSGETIAHYNIKKSRYRGASPTPEIKISHGSHYLDYKGEYGKTFLQFMRDSVRDGNRYGFNSYGIIDSAFYNDGKIDGDYKTNNRVRNYKNGVPHGFWEIDSGGHIHSVKLSGMFDNGKKVGKWIKRESSYHGGLQALHTLTYRNDTLIDSVREYTLEYEEKLTSEEDENRFRASLEVHMEKYFKESKNIAHTLPKMKYKQTQGAFTGHWSTGIKREEGTFKDGKLHGYYVNYTKKGKPWSTCNLLNGIKNGVAKTYFWNSPYLSHLENYKNGKLNGENIVKHGNGKRAAISSYRNNALHGSFKSWYKNGRRREQCVYKNGKRNGRSLYWYENGELRQDVTYVNGTIISGKTYKGKPYSE